MEIKIQVTSSETMLKVLSAVSIPQKNMEALLFKIIQISKQY